MPQTPRERIPILRIFLTILTGAVPMALYGAGKLVHWWWNNRYNRVEEDITALRFYGGPGDGEIHELEGMPVLVEEAKISVLGIWNNERHAYRSNGEQDYDGAVKMFYDPDTEGFLEGLRADEDDQ